MTGTEVTRFVMRCRMCAGARHAFYIDAAGVVELAEADGGVSPGPVDCNANHCVEKSSGAVGDSMSTTLRGCN